MFRSQLILWHNRSNYLRNKKGDLVSQVFLADPINSSKVNNQSISGGEKFASENLHLKKL